MKKNKKGLFLSILIMCSLLFLSGCEDNSELIEAQLKEAINASGDIAYYASMELSERTELCNEKHIEVSGFVTEEGYSVLEIGDEDEDGIYFSCTFSESIEEIKEGDYLKVQGVCTGCYSDSMYIEGCSIVEHCKPEDIYEIVKAPLSSDECREKNVYDVEEEFSAAGFENIWWMTSEFEYGNEEYSEGDVVEVIINDEAVEKGKEYASNELLKIYIADLPFAREVIFGNYEQDNNHSNKEPISWYVVKTEGDMSLLVSKEILDFQPFNDSTVANGTSWEHSTLRKWLNDTFYNSAFSNSEKEYIMTTTVQDFKADMELGGTTKDKVFLLNYDEAWTYFPSDRERAAELTTYARAQKDITSNKWWLINSYSSDLYKYTVNEEGEYENSPRVNESEGVRPAIWVKAEAIE